MTKNKLEVSLESENNQPTFLLALTLQQLRKHWQLMLIGSAMAEYLELLEIPDEWIKTIAINPTHLVVTCMQYAGRPYEKHLAQQWLKLGDELAEVYSSIRSVDS